jgi:hypothetical protein
MIARRNRVRFRHHSLNLKFNLSRSLHGSRRRHVIMESLRGVHLRLQRAAYQRFDMTVKVRSLRYRQDPQAFQCTAAMMWNMWLYHALRRML